MIPPQAVELTLGEAAELVRSELAAASRAFQTLDAEGGTRCCTCALGLALQLGALPSELVLLSILEEAQTLARRGQADALSTLGPALVDLVAQVRGSQASSSNVVMEAWTAVAEELGALLGQVGLALSMQPEGRAGLVASATTRACLLDEATQGLFGLRTWLGSLELGAT